MKVSFQQLSFATALALVVMANSAEAAKSKGSGGNGGQRHTGAAISHAVPKGTVRTMPNASQGNLGSNKSVIRKINPQLGQQLPQGKPQLNLKPGLVDLKPGKLPGGISLPNIPKLPNGQPGNASPGNQNHGLNDRLADLGNLTNKRPPAVKLENILKHPPTTSPMELQKSAACAPKFLTCHPHFNWWLNILICHHHHWCGGWYYQNYCWDYWRPCYYTTVCYEQWSYYVGLNCVYIPDMQAYGVQSVVANSPAAAAGLKAGDLILSINGLVISHDSVLNEQVNSGRLEMQVVREGADTAVPTTVVPQLLQTVVN